MALFSTAPVLRLRVALLSTAPVLSPPRGSALCYPAVVVTPFTSAHGTLNVSLCCDSGFLVALIYDYDLQPELMMTTKFNTF